jgi:hypothetical protein
MKSERSLMTWFKWLTGILDLPEDETQLIDLVTRTTKQSNHRPSNSSIELHAIACLHTSLDAPLRTSPQFCIENPHLAILVATTQRGTYQRLSVPRANVVAVPPVPPCVKV